MLMATAPGKVVLVGEYAVLDGAPAIVLAVSAGARIRWTAAPRTTFVAPDGDALLRAAWDDAGGPPGHIEGEPVATFGLPSKPGLGGSAAAVVAAIRLAHAAAGRDVTGDRLAAQASAVHRRIQGGGSGVDVAASTFGGCGRFLAGSWTALRWKHPFAVVWTGESVATGPRVARYLDWNGREAFVARAAEAVARWQDDPIAAIAASSAATAAMAAEVGFTWDTPVHKAVAELARQHGGAAKPSGAGGGDVAVALFNEPNELAAFLTALPATGGVHLPVGVGGPPEVMPT